MTLRTASGALLPSTLNRGATASVAARTPTPARHGTRCRATTWCPWSVVVLMVR
jgi:hypothetical protein